MRRAVLALTAALSLAASPALAHAGHGAGDGFAAGFVHPFTGLDHLLAMAAVGLWAGLALRRAWWVWPAAFMGAMLAGFALGVGGSALPAAEAAILASTVALGLAAACRLQAPVALGSAAVAAFGLAHGYAHGQESPAGAASGAFAAGFIVATAALHAGGLGLAWGLKRMNAERVARAAGLAAAATGVALVWQG